MFRSLALASLALIGASALSIARAEEKPVVIGTGTMDLSGSGIAIDVSKARGAFRGIRLLSKSGTANLKRIQIIYNDGAVLNEDNAMRLVPGERSEVLGDTGRDRFIDAINITNEPSQGKAVIEVVGIQAAEAAGSKRSNPASGDVSFAPTIPTPDTDKPGVPKETGGVLFGYQNVGFGIDRDIIKVGGDIGKFDRIRLRVLGNDIHINALKVVYMDGDTQDVAVDAVVRANTRSKWFDLKGDRFIREIAMTYQSKPNLKGQARVEVTGEYAKDWLGGTGEGRKYNQGWVLLGAQTAGFTGFDRDTILVGRNEGGYSRLRIETKDRAITLREIRVKYFEGPDEVFTMNDRVDPDRPFGPLEFRGGKAPIKAIQAKYRSRFDFIKGFNSVLKGNPAIVQIWGQH
jgi:hypothetical protein